MTGVDFYIMAPTYYPAHKTGGPVPGIRGVVHSLQGHRVRLLTPDRDLDDAAPFSAPYCGTITLDNARVTYLAPLGWSSLPAWTSGLREMRASDVVYFNSVMHKTFTVLPMLLLALLGFPGRVAISPRGELASSALGLGGSWQKRVWVQAMTLLGLARRIGSCRRDNVVWLASSEHERADILAAFPRAFVVISPERLRELDSSDARAVRPSRSAGLRVVSVGRVAPGKGTLDLVLALAHVRVPVTLDLVGHPEDPAYVERVHEAADALPPSIEVHWHGGVAPEQVRQLLDQSHLMVSLTHGENFGHAIGEALRRGSPVLLSDQTPWSFVAEQGAGLVLREADCRLPVRVAEAIDAIEGLSDEAWSAMSEQARLLGTKGLVVEGSTTLAEAVELLPR